MADYGEGIRNYDRFTVRPRSGRLDDDRWHDVRIVREGRKVCRFSYINAHQNCNCNKSFTFNCNCQIFNHMDLKENY